MKEETAKNLYGMSWFKITKLVYEKDVFFADKLSMLYSSLHKVTKEVALVVHKKGTQLIDLYIGARDFSHNSGIGGHRAISGSVLADALKGFLPGIILENAQEQHWSKSYAEPSVSSVSGVASLRDDKKETFVQGIERLINTTAHIPQFTAIFIAGSIGANEQLSLRNAYETIYSQLMPFSESQYTFSSAEGETISNTLTKNVSETIGTSLARTITHGTGTNESESETEGTNKSKNSGLNLFIFNKGKSSGSSKSNTKQSGSSTSYSESDQRSENESKAVSEGTSDTSSTQKTDTRGIQLKLEDKRIKEILKTIDKQLERMRNSESFGLWNCATYFISNSHSTSQKLGNIYRGIITGKDSGIESSVVNSWEYGNNSSKEIITYLDNFIHPQFLYQGIEVTPGSMVDSEELCIHLSLPQSSVPGVLVKQMASFGRNVVTDNLQSDNCISVGHIVHLEDESDEENKVNLDIEALSMHTFITGTTGSGKSNTIYLMLDELKSRGKKFLIIEPAKGEYKNIFGHHEDVTVYGTNPNLTQLLRINPFTFPPQIHVLEHIDRLIEIFNACWPMYAAMPAVLKKSIEDAYEQCGWDLVFSNNKYDIYPTFGDVLEALKNYINKSEYSSESKSDYKGALETRIQSLTTGIVGELFRGQSISDEQLFNENTIVDLSRIGSVETKSLLMGILVLKLNEFRLSEEKGMNLPLRHITVLEEAHNLLKRTSHEQSQESSNIAGKSVEMITNSIAEMRTYGEGFIIADQSPEMLDSAAIRNTNTKIIMALPDYNDREVAGKSIGLSDEQIDEIGKQKKGIAIIYQNNWAEAVQCKIRKFEKEEKTYRQCDPTVSRDLKMGSDEQILMFLINGRLDISKEYFDEDELKSQIRGRNYQSNKYLFLLLSLLNEYRQTHQIDLWNDEKFGDLAHLVYGFLSPQQNIMEILGSKKYPSDIYNTLMDISVQYLPNAEEDARVALSQCFIRVYAESKSGSDGIEKYENWREFYKSTKK